MTTPQQVKQALELALSLSEGLNSLSQSEAQKAFEILGEINKNISKSVSVSLNTDQKNTSSSQAKESKHPVESLLEKGKIKLKEGRRKQLTLIYDELQIMKVKFLGAKQNQHVTWFPLEMNGDKSAALYLGNSGGWVIEPLSIKANGELSGEWEGFDLTEFMAMNCPAFDQDDY